MFLFVELVGFLLLGKLSIYLLQIFPPAKKLTQRLGQTAQHFFECDLCLGVWVYFILSELFDYSVLDTPYKLINWFLTGAILSFIAHIFALGWKAKFEPLIISD